jgi:hypothetical protein
VKEGLIKNRNVKDRKARIAELEKLVTAHVKELMAHPMITCQETLEQQEMIDTLALALARGRAAIQYATFPYLNEDGRLVTGREIEEPQIEAPYRLAQQLRNLGWALAHVHGRTYLTAHELELLRAVVLSTITASWQKVLAVLGASSEGLTCQTCADGIGKSRNRAEQLLKELVAVGLVAIDKSEALYRYRVMPDFAAVVRKPMGPLDHIKDVADSNLPQN